MRESQESDAIIATVDDDRSVRRGLERLIRSVGVEGGDFRLRAGIPGPPSD
jgi:FixJ family two-component response regulator